MYLKMNTLNLFSLFLNLIFCYYQPQPLFSKIPASFLFFFPLIQIVFSLNDFHHSLHGSSIQMLFHITQFFFSFIFIGWRLITLQYCSGFCHTLTWISHGFTCAPHPDPPSNLPLHLIPLGLPSAPALSTCLMHPTWAGGLFHPW